MFVKMLKNILTACIAVALITSTISGPASLGNFQKLEKRQGYSRLDRVPCIPPSTVVNGKCCSNQGCT
uniref:Uncharacterized protein n=1 Tax=Phakopsora pachyrhizi TaxID=170000 RepID=A0A0S1MJI5_PHAPC